MYSFFYFDNTLGFHHALIFSREADNIGAADTEFEQTTGLDPVASSFISCQIIRPNLDDQS